MPHGVADGMAEWRAVSLIFGERGGDLRRTCAYIQVAEKMEIWLLSYFPHSFLMLSAKMRDQKQGRITAAKAT